jgi:hypothetical protein
MRLFLAGCVSLAFISGAMASGQVLQPTAPQTSIHVYEVRPRSDNRGVDLISDALPFGGLWYLEVSDAIDYAKFRSRSHHAVIRVYDEAGDVVEMHDHASA